MKPNTIEQLESLESEYKKIFNNIKTLENTIKILNENTSDYYTIQKIYDLLNKFKIECNIILSKTNTINSEI